MTVDEAMQIAIAHLQAGRLFEAEKILRQVLAAQPNHPEALHRLGILAGQAGQRDWAIELIERAIAQEPEHFPAFCNLSNFLLEAGRYDDAIAACKRAIQINPEYADAYNNLGNAMFKHNRPRDAMDAFDHAIAINPNHAAAHNNRGLVYALIGSPVAALDAFRRAIAINPAMPMTHSNIGTTLNAMHRFDEALAAFDAALQLKPDGPEIHWGKALTLLTTGDFARGWEEFEWRLQCAHFGLPREYRHPQWNGQDLSGKTLLLHVEAGYGDAMQFARYVPLLNHRGAKLILECHPPLIPLLAELPGLHEIIQNGAELPDFDFHIGLQSLPRIFKTDLSNIPNTVPYLKTPAQYALKWQSRVQGKSPKVGLVWKGVSHDQPPKGPGLHGPDMLKPLSTVRNVQFFSLQKGPGASIPRPAELELTDFVQEFEDFADTAAVIDELDLVISVDTSVAHLAGALARPVWVILPFSSDFRWLTDREDSPWYPTMRLFRQKSPNDVTGPMDRIVAALKLLRP